MVGNVFEMLLTLNRRRLGRCCDVCSCIKYIGTLCPFTVKLSQSVMEHQEFCSLPLHIVKFSR